MSKKIKLLLAAIMSLSMVFATTACGETTETPESVSSETESSEIIESSEEVVSSEESSEEESSEEVESSEESSEEESSEEVSSEESSEEESSEEESSEEESSEEESSEENVTDNEIGPKAKVEVITTEGVATTVYDVNTFSPTGESAILETAFAFSITETAEEAKANEYANWIADYYVSVDTAVAAGSIGLAGSYDSWYNGEWISFYSPIDLEAGQEFGLLSTMGSIWTYAEIAEFVDTFRCGAFDLNDACAGVTLKVELRLTNPEDATDTISVCVIEYKFA